MSAAGRPPSAPLSGVLCLGEALVDLVCEHPVQDVSEAAAFVPHFGGVVANVAVVAARSGARVRLAGVAGEDSWGWWLRHRLEDEGIDVSLFRLLPGRRTAMALATVDEAGEPSYAILGESQEGVALALGEDPEAAVTESAALFFTSNTLAHQDERELTMRLRQAALQAGRPVVFDLNVRLHRWRSRADAAASSNACVPGTLLVRCNQSEAELLTGESDPERAAQALLKGGARMVVVTLGSGGAILRGELRADADARPARVMSTIGAGDVLTGVLLARLALAGFYPPAVAAALPDAVARAAEACERWGALD